MAFSYRAKWEPLIFIVFSTSSPSLPPHTSHMVKGEDSQECFVQFQALIHIPPNLPPHTLKQPSPTRHPRDFTETSPNGYLGKKVKQKRFKVLVLSPRGSMRWDTDGQGLPPLQPAPEPPPDPWLPKQGGAGASTGPGGSVSGSGGAPGSIIQLGHCGRTQKKKKKTLSSNKGRTLNSIPVSIPRLVHT